jgi:hypothetical protein
MERPRRVDEHRGLLGTAMLESPLSVQFQETGRKDGGVLACWDGWCARNH